MVGWWLGGQRRWECRVVVGPKRQRTGRTPGRFARLGVGQCIGGDGFGGGFRRHDATRGILWGAMNGLKPHGYLRVVATRGQVKQNSSGNVFSRVCRKIGSQESRAWMG